MALLAIFRSRRMAVLFLFGFSSGLPLLLTGQLLGAWLADARVDLSQIAAFSLVGLAYTFKFSWAPLLDRYQLPFLGRRRGWILAFQLALTAAIIAMGSCDPTTQPELLAVLAVAVATLSASQDIVLDAYNADLLSAEERAAGAAIYVVGYRVAMLVTGFLVLFLADFVSWQVVYTGIGLLMLVGVLATLFAEEPPAPARPARTIVEAIYLPFVELFRRMGATGAVSILIFVAVYKFGDSFAQPLLIPFFRRGVGFEFSEIATFYKFVGFTGMFLGGMFAGALVAKHGLRRTLFAFGILQACTNLLYALLATTGKSYWVLGGAVLCDNVAGAMGTAAFVAFLMSVCSAGVSATQFALLTSLSSVGQRVFGPFSDDLVVRLDPGGVAHLATTAGTIDQALVPHAEQAVAGFDWGRLAELGELSARLGRALNPEGTAVVIHHQWPEFFAITAAMALPGIALALYVTKFAQRDRDP